MTDQRFVNVDIGLDELSNAIDKHGIKGPMVWAQSLLDAIPKEFWDQARITMFDDRESGWYLDISYTRPETDLDRQNDDRRRREAEAARHAEEFAQYQRLKAKYEKAF
jgi:hypothetical protein